MQADSNRITREQTVLIVSGQSNADSRGILNLMQGKGYRCVVMASLNDLENRSETADYLLLIIDVDSVTVNNRVVRDLKLKYHDIEFLCISGQSFHPDLQDAISNHFYACLSKPVDSEELFYWLKCIRENETATRSLP